MANSSLIHSLVDARESVAVTEIVRPGVYLGVPVLVVEDESDGWLLALWPDREKTKKSHGRQRPFTYAKGEWWRLWGAQVGPSDHEYERPTLPLMLEPKLEPVDA